MTQENWTTDGNENGWSILDANNTRIAAAWRDVPNAPANARLIAAAPDLLAALESALADLEGIMPEFEPSGDRRHPAWITIYEAQDAIAKAKGN